jgi:hypothetical protein
MIVILIIVIDAFDARAAKPVSLRGELRLGRPRA